MPAEQHVPPPRKPLRATASQEWVSWAPTQASYVDLAQRLTQADLQLCELQAHMDELVEANCRLRAELSEMTLQWVVAKTRN